MSRSQVRSFHCSCPSCRGRSAPTVEDDSRTEFDSCGSPTSVDFYSVGSLTSTEGFRSCVSSIDEYEEAQSSVGEPAREELLADEHEKTVSVVSLTHGGDRQLNLWAASSDRPLKQLCSNLLHSWFNSLLDFRAVTGNRGW
ncbi:hypothetical protein FOZ63_001810 [Perkinsus olseni]|uniref:Uncharacterized protein n=1 Tax=Perkinsus olseni TaxID=32597 RepID=A0A7J6PKA3_PEROL|nr:hypothetical protein FOZ63_001810 [Perkinsus olseni]